MNGAPNVTMGQVGAEDATVALLAGPGCLDTFNPTWNQGMLAPADRVS